MTRTPLVKAYCNPQEQAATPRGSLFRMIQLVTVASVLGKIRPQPVIDTQNAAAVDLWAQRLGVSRDDLLAAVAEVGNSIAAVRRQLRSAI